MLTYDDLVNDMEKGCKPKDKWRLGIEHEQFVYLKTTGESLPYDGNPGILQILEGLIDQHGWSPVRPQGKLIALEKGRAMVTLEPGGQVEFSGAPLPDLVAMKREANEFYRALGIVTGSLGIGVLPVGFHPVWRRDQIHTMPKERYKIMFPYMEKKGRYGVDMMLRTCGAQINLDFSSEADMVKKYRVALGLQPVVTALMANSHQAEGKDTGYKSYRSLMWTDTDPDRCGIPDFVFGKDMGFARYVDYALDVPMYFIMRDGHHVDVAGQSFRAFMNGKLPGFDGQYPSLDDWHDHLTTLFPEVRLKRYLELRGPDSAAPALVYGMAAFWTGILYDEDALDQAWDLIRDWTPEFHKQLRMDVTRHGLHAPLPERQTLLNMAMETIQIAEHGLARQSYGGREDLDALKGVITFDALTT
ncbi:MAG: glutamate--cysteine ligase [Micavibrio sp.]